MSEYQIQKQYHVKVDGEEIAVTEEVYYAYKRPFWKEYKRREREARCRDARGICCTGDCICCDRRREGAPLSLEQLMEDGITPAEFFSFEEDVERMELYQALYAALDMLDEKDRRIAALYAEGLPERDIAGRVGLSQKGINYRKGKIFSRLRELLEDFR